MTTTVVRDSIVGDNWIYQTSQQVPIQRVIGDDGQPTGDILTGPVRLSWPDLFELPKATAQIQNPKYGSVLMFTPYADFAIIYEEYYVALSRDFGSLYEPTTQQYYGVHSPFRDQAEKAQAYQGYTPGCVFMTCSSQFKPPVVDARGNPIVDHSKVYPGVWAICSIKPYAYGKDAKGPTKKGIGFGLQTVMLIGDDTNLGGGAAADPKATFKGVQVQAPITRPPMTAFQQGQQPAPSSIAPQQPPIIQTTYRPAAPSLPQMAPPPMATGDDDDWSFMN